MGSRADPIHGNLDPADCGTRRDILRTLIDRVVVEPDQIRILYRINGPRLAKKAGIATIATINASNGCAELVEIE